MTPARELRSVAPAVREPRSLSTPIRPSQPSARPENNHPAEMAWQNIQTRNRIALEELIPEFSGRDVEAGGAECRGPTLPFDSYVVHTDCWVRVSVDGAEPRLIQLFKDVLDWDGELKIFRYYEP